MSLNSDIRDQAYQFFIEEAQELLQVLEEGLLNLKQDYSTPKIHELMRAAHSIKGGAASVELDAIKTLAHHLEDFLKALYSDKIDFNNELESLLLQAYDCLRDPLSQQMETGNFDGEVALATAEPIFAQLEEKLGDAIKEADNYIPSSTDLGVDIVCSIFEVDVAQSIERLNQVITNPNDYEVAGELRTQAEVFAGFAELLNLPGFGEIAQTALTALDLHSDRALEIVQLMLADCQSAREVVLAGDRDRGGEPSAALLALAQPGKTDSTTSPVASNLQEVTETAPSLDDVFGTASEAIAEAPPSLDDVFSTPSEAIAEAAPSLDDVFGTASEAIAEAAPSLDDVFGATPEPAAETAPSLDDVFNTPLEPAVAEEPSSLDDVFGATPEPVAAEPQLPSPENLEAAVESIGQVFEQLPAAQADAEQLSVSLPAAQKQKSVQPRKSSQTNKPNNVPTNLTVRVDLSRLERMNNLIGELVINRNSLSLQNEQLQSNVKELMQKFARFRSSTVKLRELSDQVLVESERSSKAQQPKSQTETEDISLPQTEFDSLEMDNYSHLHLLLQGILEEMMQLEESVDDIVLFARQSNNTIEQQRQMLGQMRDELMWARMLPLEQILQRFPRVLRDLSHKYDKSVGLTMTGTGVLVDKAVLEKLYDPLLHLLRNAFDHGIEPPKVRQQQGKPEQGQIEIRAYYQGNQTIIEVKDDGQGINLNKVTKKAIKKGLISPQQAAIASQEELFDLIFEPGFSTADKVSEISGRGVGMNVVRSQLQALKGTVTATSAPGKGTTFTLRLPLTLTIAKLLVCSIGSKALAFPSDSIEEIIIPTATQVKSADQQKFLAWNQQLIPIYPLAELLQYNCTLPPETIQSRAFETVASPKDWALPLLLLRQGQQLYALEVERLISEQELVIKPFGAAIAAPNYSYGCTILGDGTLIPVINGAVFLEEIIGGEQTRTVTQSQPQVELALPEADETEAELIGKPRAEIKAVQPKLILVVDDSAALRRTIALSLEKQGYRVLQARDGREALSQLQNHPDVSLVICDIEMPNMNGFEFLGMRRRDSDLVKIPVIMLTSRSGDKHRNLAIQLGANGYFTKPYIEQEFIREIQTILKQQPSGSQGQNSAVRKAVRQTILIVDDSSALRRTMTLSLENKGYRILQARDGQEALEQLQQHPEVKLVICDIEMPNMNGFEFLSARRQEPQLAKIPVAMLTSRNSDKHRRLAQQLGAIGYFTKPYVEEEFHQEIKKLLPKQK